MMRNRRWRWILVGIFLFGGGIWLWRTFVVHWIEPIPGTYDNSEKSSNLSADLKLMWETQQMRSTSDPTHGPNPRASTDRAINAASRVFNTVELTGRIREEVYTLLGDPKASNDSIYNFPFWSTTKNTLVYRFDCGSYGWQFNVELDADNKVSDVKRKWIH